MKIAIATPVLFDKSSPFNHLFKDILGGFLDAGHEIVRLVAVRDDKEDAYKFGYDSIQYVKFKRKESGHSNIIFRYARDTVTNMRQAAKLKACDAEVLFEDVTYSSFWTVRAAKKKNMRVVAMLQDVWPDNAVQCDLIKSGGMLYKYFEYWQKYVYRKADKIICISDDMKAFIVSKGIDEKKIEVIYNWGYSDDVINISWEENEFVKKYNLDKNVFYVVYAGNIGRMQNVELVVEAAKELKKDRNIQFLIVGDGANRANIERLVNEYQLGNVTMLPRQEPKLAASIYSTGINFITIVRDGLKVAFPSKTSIIMSCNAPMICTFGKNTYFAGYIKKYTGIFAVEVDDLAGIVSILKQYSRNRNFFCDSSHCFKDMFRKEKNIADYCNIVTEDSHEDSLY